MSRDKMIQYYLWHPKKRILRGPYDVSSDPAAREAVFAEKTAGERGWMGGTLDRILKDSGSDRQEIAKYLRAKVKS